MESGQLIAIFCNSFPPEGGGASARIYNLAVLLRDKGYRVQVVCAMPNYPTGRIFDAYRGKVVVDEVVEGINVRRVWLYPSNVASASVRGISMMSLVYSLKLFGFSFVRSKRPALVIVSTPPLLMASACVRYFRKRNTRLLLNVSDLWPLSANALGALDTSHLYRRLELRAVRMYQAVDAITAQSNETLKHILEVSKRKVATMLVRNLPASIDNPENQQVPDSNLTRIIYPGLLGHAQGILELCKAIDFQAIGAELHIYGEGAELSELRNFCDTYPQRGIRLHQPVPPSELQKLLANYHAVLVPLVAPIEGALPSKLFTAAQAGVPVLYSGGGEGEALVREYDLGFVAAPSDYDTIAEQIRILAGKSVEEQHTWRRRIKELAGKAFDKDLQDNQLLDFISNIIK